MKFNQVLTKYLPIDLYSAQYIIDIVRRLYWKNQFSLMLKYDFYPTMKPIYFCLDKTFVLDFAFITIYDSNVHTLDESIYIDRKYIYLHKQLARWYTPPFIAQVHNKVHKFKTPLSKYAQYVLVEDMNAEYIIHKFNDKLIIRNYIKDNWIEYNFFI